LWFLPTEPLDDGCLLATDSGSESQTYDWDVTPIDAAGKFYLGVEVATETRSVSL
jgi:hypothetical protein